LRKGDLLVESLVYGIKDAGLEFGSEFER